MSSPDPFRPVALPYIDEMPKYKRIALAKFVLEATEKCFAQPGAEEKYQASAFSFFGTPFIFVHTLDAHVLCLQKRLLNDRPPGGILRRVRQHIQRV